MGNTIFRNPPESPFEKGGLEGPTLIQDNITYLPIEPLRAYSIYEGG